MTRPPRPPRRHQTGRSPTRSVIANILVVKASPPRNIQAPQWTLSHRPPSVSGHIAVVPAPGGATAPICARALLPRRAADPTYSVQVGRPAPASCDARRTREPAAGLPTVPQNEDPGVNR